MEDGGVISMSDTFESLSADGASVHAIDFRRSGQKYQSRVVDGQFKGNGHAGMVAIRLKHQRTDTNDNAVLIAGNVFDDVRTAIDFSGTEVIAPNSHCNIWIAGDANSYEFEGQKIDVSSHCIGAPLDGYVHFADSHVCKAENAVVPEDISCDTPSTSIVPVTPTPSCQALPVTLMNSIAPSMTDLKGTSSSALQSSTPGVQESAGDVDTYFSEIWAPVVGTALTFIIAGNIFGRLGMHVPVKALQAFSQIVSWFASGSIFFFKDYHYRTGLLEYKPSSQSVIDVKYKDSDTYSNEYSTDSSNTEL